LPACRARTRLHTSLARRSRRSSLWSALSRDRRLRRNPPALRRCDDEQSPPVRLRFPRAGEQAEPWNGPFRHGSTCFLGNGIRRLFRWTGAAILPARPGGTAGRGASAIEDGEGPTSRAVRSAGNPGPGRKATSSRSRGSLPDTRDGRSGGSRFPHFRLPNPPPPSDPWVTRPRQTPVIDRRSRRA